jgi:hypothetical protein
MDLKREQLIRFYTVLGIVTFIGMWASVAWFLLSWGGPFDFPRALVANPAALMITIEMGCMAVVASIIMYRDADKVRLNGWLLVALGIVVGFGVVFPLFLAARERWSAETSAHPL